jgi:hypothetical protein
MDNSEQLWDMNPETNWNWALGNGTWFTYVATPTPYIKHILEEDFGPLDWEIPYV